MVTTNFYLDTRKGEKMPDKGVNSTRKGEKSSGKRNKKKSGNVEVCEPLCALRINITHRRRVAAYPLGISIKPSQWDKGAQRVVNHPNAGTYNVFLTARKLEVDRLVLKLEDEGLTSEMSAVQVRDYVLAQINPERAEEKQTRAAAADERQDEPQGVADLFARFMAHKGNGRTAGLYQTTLNRLRDFLGEEGLSRLRVEDIDAEWLMEFDDFMALTAPSANARAINMRNLRAVCNFARKCKVTAHYPFLFYKIKQEATRKRNFDVPTLRRILLHECREEWQQKYLDFFKLTFMLIGINAADLCALTRIEGGRVNYVRAKTKKRYSVKVEPEALYLIERYRSEGHLLGYMDKYADYRCFYNSLCKGLKAIKAQLGLAELTTYWARHSWATIAYGIGIPVDTIAQALGHGGNTVTDIYIERDVRRVDEANRAVLDWVLYGKAPE